MVDSIEDGKKRSFYEMLEYYIKLSWKQINIFASY